MWSQVDLRKHYYSGGDGIPVELFQILEDTAVKVPYTYASKLGELSGGHKTGKGQVSF